VLLAILEIILLVLHYIRDYMAVEIILEILALAIGSRKGIM
jgi:hypothetical protein